MAGRAVKLLPPAAQATVPLSAIVRGEGEPQLGDGIRLWWGAKPHPTGATPHSWLQQSRLKQPLYSGQQSHRAPLRFSCTTYTRQ